MAFNLEKDFEEALCNLLVEKRGWVDGILFNPSETDLLKNWANFLNETNNTRDRLNGFPLTDTEVEQLLSKIRECDSPFKANNLLLGESLSLIRDNPDDQDHLDQKITIQIFNKRAVGGGKNRYQIARQPRFKTTSDIYPSQRGDLTLLINGLPVIHIELKRSNTPLSQAYNQIRNYLYKGVFTGFFSTVQLFVAMTPEETKYFANPGERYVHDHEGLNTRFMFNFADEHNVAINDWERVGSRLLSIPMAHKMVSFYTIAEHTNHNLLVMRPYQMYAVDRIKARVSERERAGWNTGKQLGGYIWHTTGSGKTLTSYKVCTHLVNMGLADRTILVVDRLDLNEQTRFEYERFSGGIVDINEASNSESLKAQLIDTKNNKRLFITTINKLANVAKGASDYEREKLAKQRIVVIVDECHRSQFGEMMSQVKAALPCAIFFGFTGTPISSFNAKYELTTKDVFGDCIAQYTIANGIHDGNVLEFDLRQLGSFDEEALREAVAIEKAKAASTSEVFIDKRKRKIYERYMHDVAMCYPLDEETGDPEEDGIEDYVHPVQFDTDEYRRGVVGDIKKSWLETSFDSKFHAILATSSISEAVAYFHLVRELIPTLKVTAIFDPSEDYEENGLSKIDGLNDILNSYNKIYSKQYNVGTYADFKVDVMNRLAHKGSYKNIEFKREECLDLVIVVNQLLTGYDSAWVRTLYLDKYLKHEAIIQAFSRTNRLLDDDKPFGIIRYFRKPHSMKRNIEFAIRKYSGGEKVDIIVVPLAVHIAKVNAVYEEIKALFESCGHGDFARLPEDKVIRAKFVRAMNKLIRNLIAARAQGFKFEDSEMTALNPETGVVEVIELDRETGEIMSETCELTSDKLNKLLNRYIEIDHNCKNEGDYVPYDIDVHVTTLSTEKIDADYIDKKFHDYIDAVRGNASTEAQEKALDDLHSQFPYLKEDDQVLADRLIQDIQTGEFKVREGWHFGDYLNEAKNAKEEKTLLKVTSILGIDPTDVRKLRQSHPTEVEIDAYGRYDAILKQVNRVSAKEELSKALGTEIKSKDIMRLANVLLRRYVLIGAFDVDEVLRGEI